MLDSHLYEIRALLYRVTLECLGVPLSLIASRDKKDSNGRVYIQVIYKAPCSKTGEVQEWKGAKHYLSEHMTDDEVLKKCYAAFELAVKHELLEGFKIDGIMPFNPHVNIEELLKISDREVKRAPVKEDTQVGHL